MAVGDWRRGAVELGRTNLGWLEVHSHCAAALGVAATGGDGRQGS